VAGGARFANMSEADRKKMQELPPENAGGG
jgi:hypothetical protein